MILGGAVEVLFEVRVLLLEGLQFFFNFLLRDGLPSSQVLLLLVFCLVLVLLHQDFPASACPNALQAEVVPHLSLQTLLSLDCSLRERLPLLFQHLRILYVLLSNLLPRVLLPALRLCSLAKFALLFGRDPSLVAQIERHVLFVPRLLLRLLLWNHWLGSLHWSYCRSQVVALVNVAHPPSVEPQLGLLLALRLLTLLFLLLRHLPRYVATVLHICICFIYFFTWFLVAVVPCGMAIIAVCIANFWSDLLFSLLPLSNSFIQLVHIFYVFLNEVLVIMNMNFIFKSWVLISKFLNFF